MFHHPFVAPTNATHRVETALDWPEFKAAGVLVLNGHTHQSYHIVHSSGLHIANASYTGQATYAASALTGSTAGCTLAWLNATDRAALMLYFYETYLICRFERCSDGKVLHEFQVNATHRTPSTNAAFAVRASVGRFDCEDVWRKGREARGCMKLKVASPAASIAPIS